MKDLVRRFDILVEVANERLAQDDLFGDQSDLPDGTGDRFSRDDANLHRAACDRAFTFGTGTFKHVFLEEVFEAMAETDPVLLREELIQAVAVGVKWLEAIDKRSGK